MTEAGDILQTIVAHKRAEIAAARSRVSLEELQAAARALPPARGFARAVRGARAAGEPRRPGRLPRIVAEIKRASPSAGVLRAEFDPAAIARAYESAGAAAISCLTDERFFRGSLDALRAARAAVRLPVLRKEFIIDPYQVWEARAAGADAVLLIAGMVSWSLQRELAAEAKLAGLDVLLEVHSADELEPALALAPDVLGINNRDLRSPDLKTDLSTTLELAPRVPPAQTLIAESGIRTRDDLLRLAEAGIDGALIGEHLMRAPEPGAALAALLGRG